MKGKGRKKSIQFEHSFNNAVLMYTTLFDRNMSNTLTFSENLFYNEQLLLFESVRDGLQDLPQLASEFLLE